MSQKLFIIEFDKFSSLAPYNIPLDPNRTLPLLYVYIYIFLWVYALQFSNVSFVRNQLPPNRIHCKATALFRLVSLQYFFQSFTTKRWSAAKEMSLIVSQTIWDSLGSEVDYSMAVWTSSEARSSIFNRCHERCVFWTGDVQCPVGQSCRQAFAITWLHCTSTQWS